MRAIRFGAVGVQGQRVFLELEATRLGHALLPRFNLGVVKLFDVTAIQADQVVVVLAFIDFVNRFA